MSFSRFIVLFIASEETGAGKTEVDLFKVTALVCGRIIFLVSQEVSSFLTQWGKLRLGEHVEAQWVKQA